jgi:hypothetical protein
VPSAARRGAPGADGAERRAGMVRLAGSVISLRQRLAAMIDLLLESNSGKFAAR